MTEISARHFIAPTNKCSSNATSEAMIVGGDIQAKMLASCNRHSQILLAVCLSVNCLGSVNTFILVCGYPVFSLNSVFCSLAY